MTPEPASFSGGFSRHASRLLIPAVRQPFPTIHQSPKAAADHTGATSMPPCASMMHRHATLLRGRMA